MRIFGESATFFGPTEPPAPTSKVQSSHPCRGGRLCPPAEYTVFTEFFGEFVTSQRADVGIGPYRVLRKFAAAHRAEQICQAPTGVYRKREIGIYSGGYYVHLIRS